MEKAMKTGKIKKIISFVLALTMVLTSSASVFAATDFIVAYGTQDFAYAIEVLDIVNEERAKEGLDPLKLDQTVTEAAMTRAAEVLVKFSHDRPNGESCFSVLGNINASMGENIAYGQRNPVEVMDSWMNSPGHRKNILTSDYNSIGIGCFYQGNGALGWVQLFTSAGASGSIPNQKVDDEVIIEVNASSLQARPTADKIAIKAGKTQNNAISFMVDKLIVNPQSSDLEVENKNIVAVNGTDVTGLSGGKTNINYNFLGKKGSIEVTVLGDVETEQTPIPADKPEPVLEPTPEPTPAPEPVPEPTPEPVPEPTPLQNNDPASKYTDLDKSNWFYEPVNFALYNGFIYPLSESEFKPLSPMTRGMFVESLFAIANGGNSIVLGSNFSDVSMDNPYFKPVSWAVENKITAGTGDNKFSPDEPITREQMAVFFFNFMKSQGLIENPVQNSNKFKDSATISAWATDSVSTISSFGIINGRTDGTFAPKDTARRADACSIFMQFITFLNGK